MKNINNTSVLLNKALISLNKQLELINKGYILSNVEVAQLQILQNSIIKLRNTSIILLDKNNKRNMAMKFFNLTSARISQIKKNFNIQQIEHANER